MAVFPSPTTEHRPHPTSAALNLHQEKPPSPSLAFTDTPPSLSSQTHHDTKHKPYYKSHEAKSEPSPQRMPSWKETDLPSDIHPFQACVRLEKSVPDTTFRHSDDVIKHGNIDFTFSVHPPFKRHSQRSSMPERVQNFPLLVHFYPPLSTDALARQFTCFFRA